MGQINEQLRYPGWTILRMLGRGSYGEVYEIERDVYGVKERAALKVIPVPHDESELEELRESGYTDEGIRSHYQEYLEDIAKEYQLMASMRGHSCVVSCDEMRHEPKESGFGWNVFIRMELLTPLMDIMDRMDSEEQVVKLGKDMASALALCQRRRILHRDIKPQNMFLSQNGHFKLGDFGIAKVSEKTSGGTRIGTFAYMAPEVFHNQAYGHQADLYSLGIVLYWLLNARRLPFYPAAPRVPSAGEKEEARQRRLSGEALPAPLHGSPALQRIVLKACAFDPSQRYSSAEELLGDLNKLSPSPKPFREEDADPSDQRPAAPRSEIPADLPEAPASVSSELVYDEPDDQPLSAQEHRSRVKSLIIAAECLLIALCLLIITKLYLDHFRPQGGSEAPAVTEVASAPEKEAEDAEQAAEIVTEAPANRPSHTGVWQADNNRTKEITIYRESDTSISFLIVANQTDLSGQYSYTITAADVEDAVLRNGVFEGSYQDSFGHSGIVRLSFSSTALEVEVEELERAGGRGGLYSAGGTYHKTSDLDIAAYKDLLSMGKDPGTEGQVDSYDSTNGSYRAFLAPPPGTDSAVSVQIVYPVNYFVFPESFVDGLQEGRSFLLFGQDVYVTRILQPGENGCEGDDHLRYCLSNGDSIMWDDMREKWSLYNKGFIVAEWGYQELAMHTFDTPVFDDLFVAENGYRDDLTDLFELYRRYSSDFEKMQFILEVQDGAIVNVRVPAE